MDCTCCNETADIKNQLTAFYTANRNSQLFIYGRALISVAGALMIRDTDKVNPIPTFWRVMYLSKWYNLSQQLQILEYE